MLAEFEEPIAVAVNSRGDVIVADNGSGSPKLIVYDSQVSSVDEPERLACVLLLDKDVTSGIKIDHIILS